MSYITCKDLTLGYQGKVIVRNLNFTVDAGDYLYIVGENGSGKTSLIKTILHLQPAISGTIQFSDGLKPNDIGYLPQQTTSQKDFPASVREIVLSGCLGREGFHPFYTAKMKASAQKAMERTEISNLADRRFSTLSGGQQQRVLLSRALCAASRMLLLDEPAASLDPDASASMYQLINTLNTEDGLTVIMISHDIHAAAKYAHHILHISETCTFNDRDAYLRSPEGQHYLSMEGGMHDGKNMD